MWLNQRTCLTLSKKQVISMSHNKLEEFASHTDSLEEIHENKEQIEISKAYERMPNPALLASQEFMEDKIYFRKNEEDLFS
jgi:hypothetical protein